MATFRKYWKYTKKNSVKFIHLISRVFFWLLPHCVIKLYTYQRLWSFVETAVAVEDLSLVEAVVVISFEEVWDSDDGRSNWANKGNRTWIPPIEFNVECTEWVTTALTSWIIFNNKKDDGYFLHAVSWEKSLFLHYF